MKVIGTGEPKLMTVRLEPAEAELWRETLEELRRVLLEASLRAEGRADVSTGEGGRIGFRYDERQQVERLLTQLEFAPPKPGGRITVTAPSPLVHEVAHASTLEAVERITRAIGEETSRPFHADQLECLVMALNACAATLLAIDVIENHGLDD